MIWSVKNTIYVYQKSAKITHVHAPKSEEHFYPGVTQVGSLGFSQIKSNHMGEVHIYYIIFLAACGKELELMKSWVVDLIFFCVVREEIPLVEAENEQSQWTISVSHILVGLPSNVELSA